MCLTFYINVISLNKYIYIDYKTVCLQCECEHEHICLQTTANTDIDNIINLNIKFVYGFWSCSLH